MERQPLALWLSLMLTSRKPADPHRHPLSEQISRIPLAFSVLSPVADMVAGRIVVAAVHLCYPQPVEVHRDRRAPARVSYPVDAPITGQDGGGSVLRAPPQLPDLLQAGVLGMGTVVEALVALFEHRAGSATVCSPGGVVVDPGPVPGGQTKTRRE
jgi:hypothetical protein